MKVVFLDIDGVLNSNAYDRNRDYKGWSNIDKTRLPLVKKIVDATDAKIVLTSTWRTHWAKEGQLDETGQAINDTFENAGLQIYDKTPDFESYTARSDEIKQWLSDCDEDVESYVIIDDEAFGWGDLSDNFVKTSPYIGRGLEETHVQKAIEILNKKN